MSRRTIAVDLDGTLAEYHGYQGVDHIGDPVPVMLGRVKKWVQDGFEVIIFTARATDHRGIEPVRCWLARHGLHDLEITNVKLKRIGEFWDDRAVAIQRNTGLITDQAEKYNE